MTRINLVNPKELSDQHLVAEYREIFMVGSALQRSIRSKTWEITKSKLPDKFTLNKGHVRFFYNKGKYLHKRYLELTKEMKRRGMNPNPNRLFKKEQWPKEYYNDWEPTEIDKKVIRIRIKDKLKEKPDWYRWTVKDKKGSSNCK